MKKIFKNKMIVGISCIIIAIIFAVVIRNTTVETKKTEIVVINRDMKTGEKITETDILELTVEGTLPENIISNKDDITGKYLNVDMLQNDIFTVEKINENALYGNAYLENLNGNERAISISVPSNSIGLNYNLKAGDIISIIQNKKDSDGNITASVMEELQYIEIISASYEKTNTEVETKENEAQTTLTLLVNPTQANKIAELDLGKNYHFVLVYRGNDDYKKNLLNMQKEVFSTNTLPETIEQSNVEPTTQATTEPQTETTTQATTEPQTETTTQTTTEPQTETITQVESGDNNV